MNGHPLSQLLDGIAEMAVVMDSDAIIQYANPAAEGILGWPVSALVGHDAAEFIHPDDLPAAFAAFSREVAAPRSATPLELRLRHRDGSWRTHEAWGSNLIGGPLVSGIVFLSRDITARMQEAAEAVGRRERHYRILIEHTHDIIAILNPDGTFRYMSPSAERVLGYPIAGRIGRNAFEHVHPDDAERVQAAFREGLSGSGVISRIEFRTRHSDGSWRIIEVVGKNFVDDPEIRGVVINYRDVTDRTRAEAALRQREEDLRQAQKMEAVGRLAAGVSHDFNNLLTVIKGYSGLLLKRLPPGDTLRPDVEEIRKAAEQAAGLTRQLLALSRGQLMQFAVVSLNDLVKDMAQMLRDQMGGRVEIGLGLAPALGSVRADPAQMHQVLLNLVLNARDAQPDGGSITIATEDVDLDDDFVRRHPAVQAGPHVMLSVADRGGGMDEETLSRIFEPFFTTKAPGQGTGLGLSTVYGIVKQSGGYICADSAPGAGTTFRVYLPRVEGVPSAKRRGVSPGGGTPRVASTRARTVLLVEDEPAVRGLARTVLVSGGYTVLEAGNAPDALRVAASCQGPLDLLLTDVAMPQVSGFELADRLLPARPGLRVVFMSGYANRVEVQGGALSRGHAFLAKPFNEDDLLRTVQEALDA